MFVVAGATGNPDEEATLPGAGTSTRSGPDTGRGDALEIVRTPVADAFAAGRAAVSRAGFSPGAGGDLRPKTAAAGMMTMLHTTTAVRSLM